MKIVITNVIVQNGGDAAIMLGMIEALKLIWNDCSISVFTESPEFCHKYYPHLQTGKTYGQLAVTTKLSGIRFFGRRYLYLRRKWYLICSWLFSKGVPAFLLLLDHQAKEALKEYRSADIIISCGGTYLVESYGIHAQ